MQHTCRLAAGTLVLVALACGSGCNTYKVWQADHWRAHDFQPGQIKRAAVVIPQTGQDRNKTFAEAMIVAIHERGPRLVEQQLVDAVTNESRMILRRQTDVVSTRELASRVGKELDVDTIFYADSTGRRTVFELRRKLFGANQQEAFQRTAQANQRGALVPEDVRRCSVFVHHSVGLSLRAVDVATGRIKWVGFRHLAVGDKYSEDRPDMLNTFGAVQELSETIADDIFTSAGK